ncbi:Mitochondrial uncoupling protein 2 [Halotydeus destructor]|nr:Mitochondrial uncoupling protein 2 [Halotydeus destructor]
MSEVQSQPSLVVKMVSAGTAACLADLCTFPFDVAKVRLQVIGEAMTLSASHAFATNGSLALDAQPPFQGLFKTLMHLGRREGVKGLYGGIGPGLQRQCIFASLRIGFYDGVKDFYSDMLPLDQSNYGSLMVIRIMSGITTGAMAITVAQPTDVVKDRGIKGLWKGLSPNIARNSIVNAAELVCYDTLKDLLIRHQVLGDHLGCHFVSAFGAGFFATLVASPVDVVKTRIMNSSGKYKGLYDCARTVYRENGFISFYKGFVPSFMRMGTWNVVMFVSFEQIKKFAQSYGN